MLKIGLTGGIGSGKSTVARYFADLGIPVVDADVIARELVTPGSDALAAIVDAFGPDFLRPDGTLDRARLGAHVFSDPAARRRLEGILHPPVLQAMTERAARLEGPYCILVIPLLLETGQSGLVDRVLVVDAPPELQRRRVAARDALDADRIEAVLAAQTDRTSRLDRANDVIVNDGSCADLRAQVADLHQRYLALGAA
ncbi:MAG TPA: dephospho-CoA kinase [Gammaproteobacteria bacterium]|nr:dephospho-CoA kinase [Gammaproteobacteria bacterium]